MTVVGNIRAAWRATAQAGLRDVTVSAAPLGENEPAKEVVYIERWATDIDWNTIGCVARNRRERLTLNIVIRVYRERPDQRDSAEFVSARVEQIFTAMERALADDARPLQLGGAVSWARYSRLDVTPTAGESGWVATGRTTLEAEHRPA